MSSYKELVLWEKSVELTTKIYTFTYKFPKEEMFGLTSQMRRASVSIASNVAEGSQRSTKKDFSHFLKTSLGSAVELADLD